MSDFHLIQRNACPLCDAINFRIFINFPKIPVVKCNKCNFIYSRKILNNNDLCRYYKNTFGSKRHLKGQIVNSKINIIAIERLLHMHNIKKVLDVGTGYGFLLKELCNTFHNLETVGVELSKHQTYFAKNHLGLNVINSSLVDSGLPKNSFDLVTSFEVIEHTPYPTKFILELTEFVNLGGFLIIMTDNFNSRMANSLGAGFPKWIPHSHISHFSHSTLKKAIEDTKKLEIIDSMSYTPWEVLARNAFYKFFKINKKPSDVFNLSTILRTEMHGTYKLFIIRKLVNRLWTKLTLTKKMDGDLMYFLCKKIS